MATEYLWQGGAFVPLDREAAGELLVADSWRSEGGRVAAFHYHAVRFADAVGRVSQTVFDWGAVWNALAEVIAREPETSLFPRLSLEPAGLVLAIRPCPPARTQTSLTVLDRVDPRRSPQIKGPDIARLAAAKAKAATDDVILGDSDGALLETSTGALVFWRDGGIVLSNRFERQLASVTLRQVYDRATALRIPVSFRALFPHELGEGPLWFVNAVHGVSPVREVIVRNEKAVIPGHPDVAQWRDWWWGTLDPINEGSRTQERDHPHPSLEPFA